MIKSLKTGKLIKCKDCCDKCERLKDGQPLSLDMFYEDSEYEIPEPNQRFHEIKTEILLEQLLDKLEQEAPELARIFAEMYHTVGQREVGRKLGIPHSTLTGMIKKMRDIFQPFVTQDEIIDD